MKGVKFVWTEQCPEAFKQLKGTLCSAPVLAYPDPGYPDPVAVGVGVRHQPVRTLRRQKLGGAVSVAEGVVPPLVFPPEGAEGTEHTGDRVG